MPQEAVCGGCHRDTLVHSRGGGCHQGAALCGERIEPMYQPRRPVVDTRVQQHAGAVDGEAEETEIITFVSRRLRRITQIFYGSHRIHRLTQILICSQRSQRI